MPSRTIGIDKPRLDRKRSWGRWFVSTDGGTLVFDSVESGNYQVSLHALASAADCERCVEAVAEKDAWVDQRVIDDLRRALRALVYPRLNPRG